MARAYFASRAITYEQILDSSEELARDISSEYGIGEDSRVVFSLENSVEHLVALFALWRVAGHVMSVQPTSSDASFVSIVERLNPELVIVDTGNTRLTKAALQAGLSARTFGELSFLSAHPSVSASSTLHPLELDNLAQFLAPMPPAVFFTSGSTADQKGVTLRWPQILSKGHDVLDYYQTTQDDTIALILPLSHVYGACLAAAAMDIGADLALVRETSAPAEIAQTLKQSRASVIIAPPQTAHFLFARHPLTPALRDNIRIVSMGGAACTSDTVDGLLTHLPLADIHLTYGLVETYSTVCAHQVKKPSDADAIGKFRFGAQGMVVDDSGFAAPGEQGELCIRGTVMEGYLDDEVSTSAAFTKDGWLRTGDLASIDERGVVRLHGRLKETINVGGLSIQPGEIEEVAARHDCVQDCAVVGVTVRGLETAWLAVRPKPDNGCDDLVSDILGYCRVHLAPSMLPRKIILVEEIPRGFLGKIRRKDLKQSLLLHAKAE